MSDYYNMGFTGCCLTEIHSRRKELKTVDIQELKWTWWDFANVKMRACYKADISVSARSLHICI